MMVIDLSGASAVVFVCVFGLFHCGRFVMSFIRHCLHCIALKLCMSATIWYLLGIGLTGICANWWKSLGNHVVRYVCMRLVLIKTRTIRQLGNLDAT